MLQQLSLATVGATVMMFSAGFLASASASTLSSKINVDNEFQVYVSTDDSVQGTFFGSGNSWPTTYSQNTTLTAGVDYYLHVLGYNAGGPAGFLGEFDLSGTDHTFANNTTSLLTNTTNWNGNNTSWGSANTTLTDLGANGVSPWGLHSDVASTANWIWAGDQDIKGNAYFSTKISAVVPTAVPEPFTMIGTLVGGSAALRMRKKLKAK
jgi:MSHA biogenesis protein MshQ